MYLILWLVVNSTAAGVELSSSESIPDIPDTCKNNNKYNLINFTNIYMCQQITIEYILINIITQFKKTSPLYY